MSKLTDIRSTPQELFDQLNTLHGPFTLDVAADADNHKCDFWYGPGSPLGIEDALSVDWPCSDVIWMNPPYSRGTQRKFVEKAIECARRGGKVIGLLPADTSTRLFHDLIWQRYHVDFLPKRVKFNGMKESAKFGSMVVTFELCRRREGIAA